MKNSKQSTDVSNSAIGRPRGTGNGANEPSKSIRAKWSARILRQGSLVGEASIEFSFPTRGGGQSRILAPYNNIGDRHKNRLLDELTNLLPIFPAAARSNEDAQIKFIRELVDAAPIELQPDKTGFVDVDTFVTSRRSSSTPTAPHTRSSTEQRRGKCRYRHQGDVTRDDRAGTQAWHRIHLSCVRHWRGARRAAAHLRRSSPVRR